MGRPAIGHQYPNPVKTHLTDLQLSRLDAYAKALGIKSRSLAVRSLLLGALARVAPTTTLPRRRRK